MTSAVASAPIVARSLLLALVASCTLERAPDVEAPPARHEAARRSPTTARETLVTPRPDIVRRDVIVSRGGLGGSLDAPVMRQLDDIFVRRLDLHAHVGVGDTLSVWDRGGEVVAAAVPHGDGVLTAALYEGALARRGFYDDAGHSMTGAIRARPVELGAITSRFGQRFDVFSGAPGFHKGIDYGVAVGTPVLAVAAGRVKHVGSSNTAGNFIKLAHAGGYESAYLHLERVHVKKGDVVLADDVIALSGNTGRSTGPHLHYELRLAGIALDPLATTPPSVLALGPIAEREHRALIHRLQQMEATHDEEE